MARVANARNTFACLILGAYQVALDRTNRGGNFLEWQPLPAAGAAGSLRADGIAVFVSGPAIGGAASVRVTSRETQKPHVVVARFAGDLPW